MTEKKFYAALLVILTLVSGASQAQVDNSYGAIAYSGSSHVSTTAQSWNTLEEAKRNALYNCNAQTPAKDCFIPVEFQNACGALAVDYRGDWGGWWQNPSQGGGNGAALALSVAKRQALQACRQYAGAYAAECRIVSEKCAIVFNF
jgi:hypothetical protein